ncbi:precorrin-6A reductase CobK [Octadecabacter arcticus 238]|jgi:precorrin-6A/cobalt-precorrin-6A reductase|uniref:Precorrin-6A reductase CobK n=1 Tax=Octadecabacter arcticus 238 TaxID=391616 RepID=M9RI67_9RHOB|nr:cobalt-precorrin-6A reductase [Octadecabacter arcticus]AGI72289.1 precorrin-6A reductase CobK [Octadecabacter arcticus 238]
MTLLLLAGTGDAKRIAWGLVDTSIKVIASLAGATRAPDPLPVPTRIGGFGGEDGFRDYLRGSEITAVLDATHPFAAQISDRTARICGELGLPYAQFVRPVWTPEDGDNWTTIAAPVDAVNHIANGSTVFLATGRQTLAEYANLAGRRVLVRVIDPPTAPLPFEGGEFIIGRPPFTQASEAALFRALGVTHLVSKNAGGQGGRAKLDAARELGLPVLLLDRPKTAPQIRSPQQLVSVQDALLWVSSLAGMP